MSRVLVTGGTGTIGAAIVRRLLRDPAYEVRVADEREAPQWMREGCEIHTGDLRLPARAGAAILGCTHVIHLAAIGGHAERENMGHTLLEANEALISTVIRAAIEERVERFTYLSSAEVYERATSFPTSEEHLANCPAPSDAYAFSRLAGEAYCRAAHQEHGLPYTICRAADAYGWSGAPVESEARASLIASLIVAASAGDGPLALVGSDETTRTPTHVEDIAEGVVTAMSRPEGANEAFNIGAPEELTLAAIARVAWDASGADPEAFALEWLPDQGERARRRWPSSRKARDLLEWEPRILAHDGIAASVRGLRDLGSVGSRA